MATRHPNLIKTDEETFGALLSGPLLDGGEDMSFDHFNKKFLSMHDMLLIVGRL